MTERIDAYASWRHYVDHLAPIWLALPEEHRGTFYVTSDIAWWASRPGAPHPVDVVVGRPDRTQRGMVLVAGIRDHHDVNPRRTVLLNHGAGQSYRNGRGAEAYAGGPNRERVALNLEPGPLAAKAAADAGQRFVEVGCAKLDPWHAPLYAQASDSGLVAVGFHHQPPQHCAEQMTAWPHYVDAWPDLARRFRLLGHGHPRGWQRTADQWTKIAVEAEPDFAQVLNRAAVYVTDASSTGVEFASTGRPVIWCNAPWYRRDVDHGGRFWSWLDHSLSVDESAQLPEVIAHALNLASDQPYWYDKQRPMVEECYVATDGRATERATSAIVELLTS